MSVYGSLEDLVVVPLVTIVFDFLAKRGGTHPRDMILHGPSDMKSWVCYSVNANLDMTLFNVHCSILDSLCHLHPEHQHWEPTPRESTYSNFLTWRKSLSAIDYSHIIELFGDLFCLCHSIVILLTQCLKLSHHFSNLANKLIVFDIVFTILNVVTSKDCDLAEAGIFLPLEEVNLLEELLLVELQFTHRHFSENYFFL